MGSTCQFFRTVIPSPHIQPMHTSVAQILTQTLAGDFQLGLLVQARINEQQVILDWTT